MSRKSLASIKKLEEKTVLKSNLLQPYLVTWPQLQKGETSQILAELGRLFQFYPEVKKLKSAGKRKSKLKPLGKTSDKLRSEVVFGIREVTKALEKDRAALVLVCLTAKPTILTQHLIPLVATRGVPAACISKLSPTLTPLLGLKSVLALGFLKEGTKLCKSVENIKSLLTPVTLPWLPASPAKQPSTDQSQEADTEALLKHTEDHSFVATKVCINKSVCKKKKVR